MNGRNPTSTRNSRGASPLDRGPAARYSANSGTVPGGPQLRNSEKDMNDVITPAVTADAPPTVVGKTFKFFFKSPVIKDEQGNEIGKGPKPPTVVAVLPTPSPTEIIEALGHLNETEDGKKTVAAKIADLLIEQIDDIIFQGGKQQIGYWQEKNPGKNFSATDFDLSRLTLEYLATLPKGQRGAWAPSDEELKSFNEDYSSVMIELVNYDPKKVKIHCDIFLKGLARVKSDKVAVAKMKDLLTVYASKKDEDSFGEYSQVYDWLMTKADRYLAAEERDYASGL